VGECNSWVRSKMEAATPLVRMGGLTEGSRFYLLSDVNGADRVMALDWNTGASREIFHLPGSEHLAVTLQCWARPSGSRWLTGAKAARQVYR